MTVVEFLQNARNLPKEADTYLATSREAPTGE